MGEICKYLGVDEGQGLEALGGDPTEAGEGEVGGLVVLPRPALKLVEVVLQELRDDYQVFLRRVDG